MTIDRARTARVTLLLHLRIHVQYGGKDLASAAERAACGYSQRKWTIVIRQQRDPGGPLKIASVYTQRSRTLCPLNLLTDSAYVAEYNLMLFTVHKIFESVEMASCFAISKGN